MTKPYGKIGAHSLSIPRGNWSLQVDELLTSYRERIGDYLPKPFPRETWSEYLDRAAKAADLMLDRMQAWALIPASHHAEVKVILYSVGHTTGKVRIVAEVNVKSRSFVIH